MEQPKTKQRVYLLLTGLAAIACIAFIWGNSLLPAAQSAQASRSVLDLLDPILDQLHIPKGDAHRVIRKLAHMSEFALLGLLWSSLLIQLRRRSLSSALELWLCSPPWWTRRSSCFPLAAVAKSPTSGSTFAALVWVFWPPIFCGISVIGFTEKSAANLVQAENNI